MLVPVGLSNPQDIPRGLHRRNVRCLVGRVGHLEHDVDERLRGQARHRRGADVLDSDHTVAEDGADLSSSRWYRRGQPGS